MRVRDQAGKHRIPFSASVRRQTTGDGQSAIPAIVEDASPRGGTVRLESDRFRPGDMLVLSVRVDQHELLDVLAQIVRLEPDDHGGMRAGLEFQPELPRRQYALVRRLADSPAGPGSSHLGGPHLGRPSTGRS
ncbi:MAG: PilZ domain-containing protein [Planctomycetaceae bacterium]|jgi:hypothetical protein